MNAEIPNDENGNVLRSMLKRGDPLPEPREINFHFLFPTRSQAIGFIEILLAKDLRLELSWYADRQSWQVMEHRGHPALKQPWRLSGMCIFLGVETQ